MDSRMLLIPCFLMICFLAWIGSANGCDGYNTEERDTITKNDVEDFEKVRHLYDGILSKRSHYCGQNRKQRPMELDENYYDICPSETVLAEFWGIPNEGYKCWIVEPVSFTDCTRCDGGCQDWDGNPLVHNYKSVCKKKYVYESVCSFCVQDGTNDISFQLIEVPIPKCCACTLIRG